MDNVDIGTKATKVNESVLTLRASAPFSVVPTSRAGHWWPGEGQNAVSNGLFFAKQGPESRLGIWDGGVEPEGWASLLSPFPGSRAW